MGRRLGRLAGLFALGLVLVRLNRLLQSGLDLPRWDLILLAAALLGGVVWWLLSQTSLKTPAAVYLFLLGGVVVFLRVAVPATLSTGVIPTAETLPVLGDTMSTALRLIKSGVPPVYPEPGVLAILAVLLWALGGMYSYGILTGRLTAMIVPAGIVYLQFAVFDRRQAGFGWMAASATGLAMAVTAVALNRRDNVGRARDGTGRPKSHRSTSAALAMAAIVGAVSVLTASNALGMVSEYGNLPWRSGISGSVPGSGGFALDRFVDLQQRLQSRDNSVLFSAALDPDSPPPSQLYWRMETLDVFTGATWRRGGSQIRNYEPGIPIGNEDHLYQGTSVPVLQRVRISELVGERAPAAGTPTAVHQIEGEGTLAPRSFRVGRDAALFYPPGLQTDDEYQIETQFPVYAEDMGALATDPETGELTPLFAAAAEAGLFEGEPTIVDPVPIRPDDLQSYVSLPNDFPTELRAIAARETRGASSDFEQAWMLQHWFRDSDDDFTYSTNVSTGHGALVLADWLDDPESLNFRTGYCEQFAAAMAVLGRARGIPSRVVMGFTPGTVTEVDGVDVIEVRDTNAHAWVEMWMDGFGWVRFDPTPRGEFQPASITAGFDPVDYMPETPPRVIAPPVAPGIGDLPPGAIDEPGAAGSDSLRVRWGLILIPVAALLVGLIPLMKRARRSRRLRRIREGDITPAWDEIVDRLQDMGERIDDSLTPIEFARATDIALVSLANRYSAAIYGGKTGVAQEGDLVTAEWWLETRYQSGQRIRGALNPRSLLRRR